MTYTVLADAERALELHRRVMGSNPTSDSKGIILDRDGVTVAAALYENCNGANVFAHIAADLREAKLTRGFIRAIFHYPFVQLGVGRMTGVTDMSKVEARRFIAHLGFKPEAVLKRAGSDGGDAMVYALFREDCRYVAPRDRNPPLKLR